MQQSSVYQLLTAPNIKHFLMHSFQIKGDLFQAVSLIADKLFAAARHMWQFVVVLSTSFLYSDLMCTDVENSKSESYVKVDVISMCKFTILDGCNEKHILTLMHLNTTFSLISNC